MHFMNKQRGGHLAGKEGNKPTDTGGLPGGKRTAGEPSDDVDQSTGQHEAPHIHIQPHHDAEGNHTKTTVHVMHSDGRHEPSDHEPGDGGVEAKVGEHYSGAFGDEGGGGSSDEDEAEPGILD
jgi:hypothetical protein